MENKEVLQKQVKQEIKQESDQKNQKVKQHPKIEFRVAKNPEEHEEFRAVETLCYISEKKQPAKYVHKYTDICTKIVGYVGYIPASATMYIVQENGQAFLNMTCVMKEFRSHGFGPKTLKYTLLAIKKDPRVTNKENVLTEGRLEMIPFWQKRLGKDKIKFVEDLRWWKWFKIAKNVI